MTCQEMFGPEKRGFDIDASHFLEDPLEEAFHKGEDLLLVEEAHL